MPAGTILYLLGTMHRLHKFKAGKLQGDASLLSSGPGYAFYEVQLSTGEIFTLGRFSNKSRTVWKPWPLRKYEALAPRIGNILQLLWN